MGLVEAALGRVRQALEEAGEYEAASSLRAPPNGAHAPLVCVMPSQERACEVAKRSWPVWMTLRAQGRYVNIDLTPRFFVQALQAQEENPAPQITLPSYGHPTFFARAAARRAYRHRMGAPLEAEALTVEACCALWRTCRRAALLRDAARAAYICRAMRPLFAALPTCVSGSQRDVLIASLHAYAWMVL